MEGRKQLAKKLRSNQIQCWEKYCSVGVVLLDFKAPHPKIIKWSGNSVGQIDVFLAACGALMEECDLICKPQYLYNTDYNGLQHFYTPPTHIHTYTHASKYCNGFDQRFARQQLCKHSPLLGYATMEEAVFSVPAVTSRHEREWWRDMCLLLVDVRPSAVWVGRIPKLAEIAAAEAREQRIGNRSTEEYRRSACEDLTCDLRTLFMCNIWNVWD
jgi:hypothetical protein